MTSPLSDTPLPQVHQSHPSSHSRPAATNPRHHSLPFLFPTLFRPNTSSSSLIVSTAEGRPIPLDDSSAAHRTTALRQLNRSQPSSRHRYPKSSGSPTVTSTTTGTYSQPVLVRTYSGPPSSARSRPVSRCISLSTTPSTTDDSSAWLPVRDGMVISMARYKGKRKPNPADHAKLPPLEAFSFKSILADMQHDIGPELDRIAEICARSRYSLSNQYEVHMTPHGSGAGFLGPSSSLSRHHVPGGPTLQTISSDDEHASTRRKERRSVAHRRSVAYGTLETIISSSRSSDEDKGKKKPAAEIADEVRGRVARDAADENASANGIEGQATTEPSEDRHKSVRPKSTLFVTAVIDNSRTLQRSAPFPRGTGATLVGEPAKPQTSRNHLQTRTSSEESATKYPARQSQSRPSQAVAWESVAAAAIAVPEEPIGQSGLLSGFSSWIPWKGLVVPEATSPGQKGDKGDKGDNNSSYAEGSLRELLKLAELLGDKKGKGVRRAI
ncbi:hypothetical protein F4779DRAFT_249502 [Xylariaceae sp. FL0662B]|nr:hypothetical protein F4779DRAFT_249502 [Xylariaceae sp. FL0662B]